METFKSHTNGDLMVGVLLANNEVYLYDP